MEIVEQPLLGACLVTKSVDGPLIDTQRETDAGERIYITCAYVEEMARKIGMATRRDFEAVQETAERTEELEAELARTREELQRLKNAVRTTLYAGAVVEKKDGEDTFKLRPKKGEKTVALT